MSWLRLRRIPRTVAWRRHQARRPVRLVPISLALGGAIVLAAAAALALIWLILSALSPVDLAAVKPSVGEVLEIVKISLAVVAGVGGVVALVVAYRKQRVAEAGESREQAKLFAERFDKASDKLGSDAAAVRLAGVHALAALADDWIGGRQMCIDVLCAYLRMPPAPEPDPADDLAAHSAWRSMAEVRATIFRLITIHMDANASTPWHGADLDFTGVIFTTEINFTNAVFGGGTTSFEGAEFSGGTVDFTHATFSGGTVNFGNATFSGGTVDFTHATFSGGTVNFGNATFSSGTVYFAGAKFSGGQVDFTRAAFSGGTVYFGGVKFSGGAVYFGGATFSGGTVNFDGAKFSRGAVYFGGATFSGGTVNFGGATFSGGQVDFTRAAWADGQIAFSDVAFSDSVRRHDEILRGLPERAPGLHLPPAPAPLSPEEPSENA